jgi:hypothetical protein
VSVSAGVPVPRHLPPAPAWFTGRQDELDGLLSLLHTHGVVGGADAVSMVAIDGMAGVGKTAFAVWAAHRLVGEFPDGQLFIDLHGHTEGFAPRSSSEALEWFLRTLGVPARHIPRGMEERAALYRQRLSGTRTLIVQLFWRSVFCSSPARLL